MSQNTARSTAELEAPHQLTAQDRCDSCGAQAYIRVTMASGELFFCAHHANRFKEKLAPTAIEWHDESARLIDERG